MATRRTHGNRSEPLSREQKERQLEERQRLEAEEMHRRNLNVKAVRQWLNYGPTMKAYTELLGGAQRLARVQQLIINQVNKTPELAGCSPFSIVQSAMSAIEMGLEPSGFNGEAYLVPFKGEATLVVGYKGWIKLIYQQGRVKRMAAQIVYRSDRFKLRPTGPNFLPEIEHEIDPDADRPEIHTRDDAKELMLGEYAFAVLEEGEVELEYMSIGQVMSFYNKSPATRMPGSPWNNWFAQQALPRVIKRLCKRLPRHAMLDAAMALQDAEDMGHVVKPSEIGLRELQLPDESRQLPEGAAPVDLSDHRNPVTGEAPADPGEISEEEAAAILRQEAEQAELDQALSRDDDGQG